MTKSKPMTEYERRKVTEQRKKDLGLTKKTYYLSQEDIELIKSVKTMLEVSNDDKVTNDEAIEYIFSFYKQNAL